MSEVKSPAQIEVDNQPYNLGFRDGWELAHEPAECGHARANWKDPKFGTPDYRGQERCEFCDALAAARNC